MSMPEQPHKIRPAAMTPQDWANVLESLFSGSGDVDVAMLGPDPDRTRAASFTVVALTMREERGPPVFQRVIVVSPPTRPVYDDLIIAVRSRLVELGAPDEIASFLAGRCEHRVLPTVASDDLMTMVGGLPSHCALYVEEAGQLRHRDVALPADLPASDEWLAHLTKITAELRAAVLPDGPYVLMDAGHMRPRAPAARVLAEGLETSVSITEESGGFQDIVATALAINPTADPQAFARAIDLINNAEPPLDPSLAAMLRAHVLHGAGLHHHAWSILLPHWEGLLHRSRNDTLVLLAMVAGDGGAHDQARRALVAFDPVDARLELLETALSVAAEVDDEAEERILSRLAQVHPASEVRVRHIAWRALTNGDYAALRRLLDDPQLGSSLAHRELLADLLASLDLEEPDYARSAAELTARHAGDADIVRLALADDAARRHRLDHALLLYAAVAPDGERAPTAASRTMQVLERILLLRAEDGGFVIPDAVLIELIATLAAQIARSPRAPALRNRLARLLSVEVIGLRGSAILGLLVSTRAAVPRIADEPMLARATDEEMGVFMEECVDWITRNPTVLMGRGQLSSTIDATLATKLVPRLHEGIEYVVHQLPPDSRIDALRIVLHVSLLVCERAGASRRGIQLLRLAAAHLAATGAPQDARDVVEHGLAIGGTSPEDLRLMWGAYADIYHRLGDLHEGFIGALLAISFDDVSLRADEAWLEGFTLARLLRDLGFFDMADAVLGHAVTFLGEAALHAPIGTRIAVARLIIEYRRMERAGATAEQVRDIARRLSENLRTAVESHDDVMPPLVLFVQLLAKYDAELPGLANELRELVDDARSQVPQSLHPLLDAIRSARPSLDEIERLAKDKATTRFADDVAFDIRVASLLAKRTLTEIEDLTVDDALVLLDLLADRALIPSEGRSLFDRGRLRAAIQYLRTAGQDTYLLGFNERDHLVRLTMFRSGEEELCIEPADVFDRERFLAWKSTVFVEENRLTGVQFRAKYPLRYGYMDAYRHVAEDTVRRSVDRLGLSRLGEAPVAVVPDIELQLLPMNLLRHENDFIGSLRPTAMIPSLDWIADVATRPALPRGRRVAWVSDAAPEGEDGQIVLGPLAERMEPIFAGAGITLIRSKELPAEIGAADLSVVMAHGGLIPGQAYFQVLRDDAGERWSSGEFGRLLRDCHLVILFVCSAGRLDALPGARAVVGLARRLLSVGCRAVVASPWPLAVEVPPRWLPPFLAVLDDGAAVTNAVFAANQAVADWTSGNPPHAYAMHLFGDPTLRLPRQQRT